MEENTKHSFVIDASFVVAYLMPDEQSEEAKKYFSQYQKKEINLITTTLLPYEVVNSLRSNVSRKRITAIQAQRLLELFEKYSIPQLPIEFEKVLQISMTHSITCYDASYIALAKEREAKLLTFDERLHAITRR